MRQCQLEESSCWCCNASAFLHECAGYGAGQSISDESGPRSSFLSPWVFVVVSTIPEREAVALVDDVSLLFPPDSWYYGCVEFHVGGSRVEDRHACISLLVAYPSPIPLPSCTGALRRFLGDSTSASVSGFPSPSCDQASVDSLSLLDIAGWVRSRVSFIRAAVDYPPDPPPPFPRHGTFGYPGIFEVLGRQYGRSAMDLFGEEIIQAGQLTEQQEGFVDPVMKT